MANKKTKGKHFGAPFREYDPTGASHMTTKSKTKAKPTAKKPTKKPAKSRQSSGSAPEPNLAGQTAVKKSGKKPMAKKLGGVAGKVRDRQRKTADRVAKMFK